jgi:hypothetical protein
LLLFSPLANAVLALSVAVNPDPVQPGEVTHVTLTLTNPGASTSGAVTLQLGYPNDLLDLENGFISDGGVCPNNSFDSGETVTWNLGPLGPGAGVTVSLPSVLAFGVNAPPDGTVLSFNIQRRLSGSRFARGLGIALV